MTKEAKLVGTIIVIVLIVLGFGVFLMLRSPQNYANPTPATDPKTREEAIERETPNVRGKLDSAITVIEFADVQCPACAAVNPSVNELFKEYGDRVKFIFRHYPLPQHQNAKTAADAVEAAGDQGKFWDMLDALYAKQPEWETLRDPKPVYRQIAKDLGLDAEKFDKALVGMVHRDRINQDETDGSALGNPGTPTFYVNGEQVYGSGLSAVKQKIEEALKQ
ncbi:MAG: thioredoxin domain-containing protein [Candidatus Doudnabacteria bacterium]|nr:thioredoxin domain-containing protein [Candidatus Doudnabacteria bacterium]